MNTTEYVVADPEVMLGKPVIRGTRITVEFILEKLAAGESVEQVLEAHPRLTREAVLAALARKCDGWVTGSVGGQSAYTPHSLGADRSA